MLMNGSASDDKLLGTDLNDTLNGNRGNDFLFGDGGSDALDGGKGDDTLFGTGDGDEINFIDTLTGGGGADSFDLAVRGAKGNEDFYNNKLALDTGLNDYALIRDFNPDQDTLKLSGGSDRYLVGDLPIGIEDVSGTAIYLDTNGNSTFNSSDELIAILENTSALDLTASYAVYVPISE